MEMVAGGLAEAHGLGIIHRDIKPTNIFLCRQGGEHDIAKVLDFGLVKVVEGPQDTQLTHEGVVSGTPQYMAPEAMTNPETADARSDLYALGAVAYFLLTGEQVFTGNIVEILGHHLHTEPMPPSERLGSEVPPELEVLVLQCLAKRPEDRPQSAREIRERLGSIRDIPRWRRERRPRVVAGTRGKLRAPTPGFRADGSHQDVGGGSGAGPVREICGAAGAAACRRDARTTKVRVL